MTEDLNQQNKKVKTLFSKQRKFLGNYYKAVEILEPVVFLMRRSGDVEFYEDQKKSTFVFKHSDDVDRTIFLNSKKLVKFSYLHRTVRGYICHEDHPFPLPESPTLSTEEFSLVMEKTLSDIRKWKTAEIKAWNETLKLIIYGALALIGAYILFKMFIKDPETAVQTAQTIAHNASNITQNISSIADKYITQV